MISQMTLAASGLTPDEITRLLLAIAVMLGISRILGEIAGKFRQPTVLGELIAGVLLGPTLLGQVAPGLFNMLFPETGPVAIALNGLITLAVAMLLMSAGLEVDLSTVWRQGKAAILVSGAGIAIPCLMGFSVAWFAPGVLGFAGGETHLPFALFVGIALSITALPVIAKILMDLNMLKSDIGMLIMSSAMLNDLIGWIGFAMVLALLPGAHEGSSVLTTVLVTLGFAIGMLTVGRYLIHKLLPVIQAHLSWPGGVMGFVMVVSLGCAAFTESIGIHSIFGAFIAGVAIGDSRHLRERTRDTIHQFITNIFAPIFFVSIGLRVNFVSDFNVVMVAVVLIVACVGKIGGCYGGARLSGLLKDEAWAVGFGMAAQGAMGIILGQLALNEGLISPALFVAIVFMAMFTSLISGPMIQKLVHRPQRKRLRDLLNEKNIIVRLPSRTVRSAIRDMADRAAAITGLHATTIAAAVWQREQIVHTGLEKGLAVPHARLDSLKSSVVIIAVTQEGIDFDAADGEPARILCMLLTPATNQTEQIELLAMVAQTFASERSRNQVIAAASATELLAAIRLNEADANDGHD